MRGFWILFVAVLVAIGVGVGVEATTTASGPKATFKSAAVSLSTARTVQIDLGVLFPTTAHVPRDAQQPVSSADLRIALATVDGNPIVGQPASDLDAQVSLLDEHLELADVRVVRGRSLYLRVDFANVGRLSFISPADRSSLADVDALFGETWFTIPQRVIAGLEKQGGAPGSGGLSLPNGGHVTPAQKAQAQAAENRFEDDLLNIVRFSSVPTPVGRTAAATVGIGPALKIAVTDLLPEVERLVPASKGEFGRGAVGSIERTARNVPGTITATVVNDGSGSLTRAALQVAAKGTSATVFAEVAHPALDLGAPGDARQLPPSILGALERSAAARGLD